MAEKPKGPALSLRKFRRERYTVALRSDSPASRSPANRRRTERGELKIDALVAASLKARCRARRRRRVGIPWLRRTRVRMPRCPIFFGAARRGKRGWAQNASCANLGERTAPRQQARSGQRGEPMRAPMFKIGDTSTSSLAGRVFPAASIGAAHLGALVLGKPGAVIRRLGRIQSEQPGGNTLGMCRRHRRCRYQGDEGQ